MLDELVGAKLSSVTFVMDYVQLAFDGATLTAVTLPEVTIHDARLRVIDAGWRDALCGRIARVVIQASCTDNEITLRFDDAACFSISLRAEDLAGRSAESATFHRKDGRLVVFRPGE